MSTIAQLKAELGDISGHLADGAAMLRSFSARVNEMALRTNGVMDGTLRPDIQDPAVQGISGAKDRVDEAAILLSHVQKLIDTYAAGL